MQSFASDPKRTTVEVRPVFLNDEVTCPVCESYSVHEGEKNFECNSCGTTWKSFGFN